MISKWLSSEGLGGIETQSIIQTESGEVLAISSFGIISQFQPENNQFKIIHKAYFDGRRQVIPQGVVSSGNYLVIAFENELSLFDLKQRRSIYTIDKVQGELFQSKPLEGLYLSSDQDSLFLYTQSANYVTTPNFNNIDLSVDAQGHKLNFVDPAIWTLYSTNPDSNWTRIQSPTLGAYQINPDSAEWSFGDLRVPSLGIELDEAQAFELAGSIWIFGAAQQVYEYSQDKWKTWTLKSMPFRHSIEIGVNSDDRVFVVQLDNDTASAVGASFYRRDAEGQWLKQGYDNVFGNGNQSWQYSFKTLSLDGTGWLAGSWGGGFSYVNLGQTQDFQSNGFFSFDGTFNACTSNQGSGISYVISSHYNSEREEYALLVYEPTGNTRLAFWSFKDGGFNFDCFGLDRGNVRPQSIVEAPEGGYLVLTPDELIQVQENGQLGNRGQQIETLTSTAHLGRQVEVQIDSQGRIWVLSSLGLSLYCDNLNSTGLCPDNLLDTLYVVSSQLNLPEVDYTGMEVDTHGNLWLGSSEGLIKVEASQANMNSSHVKRWGLEDGLAESQIYDIAINPQNGHIWMVHPKSMSLFKSDAHSLGNSSLTQLKPYLYPSPFKREIHSQVTIQNIPHQAQVYILNSTRQIVKKFSANASQGGFIQWDVTNHASRELNSGVYYLLVKEKGGRSHLKKFIVL